MQPALLIALVTLSYLLLAGVAAWSLAVLGSLTLIAAIVAFGRTFRFPPHDRALDLALTGIVAAMAVQMVPLPSAVVGVLSPNAIPLRNATRLAVGDAPAGWVPLSIDATATAEATAVMIVAIVVFWFARGLFAAGGFTRRYCRMLGWFAGAMAVIAIVQRTVRPGLLMGVVAVSTRNASPIGPFLNRNHFAAWLLMALAVSIGYLLAHLQIHPAYRQRFRQALRHFLASGAMLSGICAVLTLVVMLLTLSRSAATGFGAAGVVGGWLGRSRLRIERTSFPTVLSVIGVLVLLVAATIDIEGWYTRMQESMGSAEFDRLTIWRESLTMVRAFPVFGTGAGTYEMAMPVYQQTRVWVGAMQAWTFFNNAHSHYVQLAAEGGLLLTVPVILAVFTLATLGLNAIRADKGEMFWIRVGAAAGLAGIAVQSIWEVSLLLPANAILCATLAALLVYRRDASRPPAGRDLRSA